MLLIKNRRPGLLALGLLSLTAFSFAGEQTNTPKAVEPVTPAQAQQKLSAQSQRYIQNAGQWNPDALFLSRVGTMDMWITRNGVSYDFYRPMSKDGQVGKMGQVVHMSFGGGSLPQTVGKDPARMITRYVTPSKTNIADSFGEVLQKGVYSGIDARSYYDHGMPRYDLVVGPGANANQIKLVFTGANKVAVHKDNITLGTQVGDQRHGKLFVYQVVDGKRKSVSASFALVAKNTVGLKLGAYDHSKTLVVDPLIYGSYYGGNGGIDEVHDVTTDDKGGTYLTGLTTSPNFPAIYGPYGFSRLGQRDAFITKLQGDAYLHDYAAYFGGSADDAGMHVEVDPFGDVWVAGITSSSNFPGGNLQYLKSTGANAPTGGTFTITYPGIGTTNPLSYNASTTQVKAALKTLLGTGGISVVDQTDGNPRLNKGGIYKIILPSAFPLTPTIDSVGLTAGSAYSIPARKPFVFLMRWKQDTNTVLTPFPQSVFYFGGEQDLTLINFAIVPNSNPTSTEPVKLTFAGSQATGATNSDIPQTPVTGSNGFIARYEYDRASRTFLRIDALTKFVGSENGGANVDLTGMAVDRFGSVYTGGSVFFAGVEDTAVNPVFLTTPGVYEDGRLLRKTDMFVRKYGANGSIVYSALLGGNGDDIAGGSDVDSTGAVSKVGSSIAVDESLNLYITGIAGSFNFPRTRGVYGEVFSDNAIVTCTKINPDASQILFSTHLNTQRTVLPAGIAVDTRGNSFITVNLHPDQMVFPDSFTFDPTTAADPNEPTSYTHGTIPITADSLDDNYEESNTSTNGHDNPASYPVIPELGTSEGGILVLDSTATKLLYGSYIGELLDERVYAPYVDKSGDLWCSGYVDTTRFYQVFNSSGVPTQYQTSGGLNTHINQLAFKRFPDTSGQGTITLPAKYGLWSPTSALYIPWNFTSSDTHPGAPQARVAVTYQRDGFIFKERITFPAIDRVVLNPATQPGGLGQVIDGTVFLSQLAPVGGAQVHITLNNDSGSFDASSIVSALDVTVPEGTDNVAFQIFTEPVSANTNLQVKADYQGSFQIVQAVIVPWLQDLSLTPTSVVGGNVSVGRIVLAKPAPASGVTVDLTTDTPSLISFPGGSTVNVPAGQTFATFNIQTQGVADPSFPTIRASLLGVGITHTLTLTQANLAKLVFSPARVAGGTTTIGTVQLDGKAGSSFTLNLAIDSGTPGYKLPKTVTVNPGDASVSFDLKTAFESSNTTRKVTVTRLAQGSYSKQSVNATIFVDAVFLTNFTLAPSTIDGGTKAIGTVTISNTAPAGGVVVNIASSNNKVATVPSTVIVPAGASSTSFDVLGQTIAVDKTATITATRGLAVIARSVTVKGVTFSMSISPTSVVGGLGTATGTVVLSSPAPVGGVQIKLSSSNKAAASVPGTVTVPAGASSASYTITTFSVNSNKDVTITGTLGVNSVTATMEVRSVGVGMVSFSPDVLRGGGTTVLTVTLEAPAPGGGATVNLSATDASLFTFFPGTITIPAGQTSASITLRTRPVSRTLATEVTATFNGSSGSAILTVNR